MQNILLQRYSERLREEREKSRDEEEFIKGIRCKLFMYGMYVLIWRKCTGLH